jgi:hypothetical protein
MWILDRVYRFIFKAVKVYTLPHQAVQESISFHREFESIYPVSNPYNKCCVSIALPRLSLSNETA